MAKDHLLRVFIVGPDFGGDAKAMLLSHPRIEFRPASTIAQADMILYTGGADVSPELYNERQLPLSSTDPGRDAREVKIWTEARAKEKFQVGYCRGSQFLNVMCGGRLWQDVNNHAVGLRGHQVWDLTADIANASVRVGSWHHQQCILGAGAKLLADAKESTHKIGAERTWDKSDNTPSDDVEAFWYPEHHCLGVQWHPEWGPKESTELFFKYIDMYRSAA